MASQPPSSESDNQSSSVAAGSTEEYQVQNMSDWSTFIIVLAVPLLLLSNVGIALGTAHLI